MADGVSSVTVFVADDQVEFRSSVQREIESALKVYADVKRVSFVAPESWVDAAEAIKDGSQDFHIGIVDILWPSEDPASGFETRGFELLSLARRYKPNMALLGISLGVNPSRDLKTQAIGAGAHEFRYRAEIDFTTWRDLSVRLLNISRDLRTGVRSVTEGHLFESSDRFGVVPEDRARTVFVVHGRSQMVREVYSFLESMGLISVDFLRAKRLTHSRKGSASVYIKEVLDTAFDLAAAIIVLLTPDDQAQLKPEYWTAREEVFEKEMRGQARPNVIFEAGLALGMDESRVILVECGAVRPMSDIAGIHLLRLSNDLASRNQLRDALRAVGCHIDEESTRWHEVGDFRCEG